MILIREIREKDVDDILRFSQIPGFISLPSEKDQVLELVRRSKRSFESKIKDLPETKYVFVAEEVETGRVVGTSMITGQHGTEEAPHFYFEVGNEQKHSKTINTGFIHGTLMLKYDTNGPTEIGGLVIDPEFRNVDEHIGRQISFVRFLYIGMHRERFKRKILAELLPPLNKKGQSPLWEAIGRRFTNMDYWEADQLCRGNKEFIFSLFPTGKIYTSFLSAEARNAIGKVGKATQPVFHMLTKIGFEYPNQVDPFDGGPHLWATVDDLLPIKRLGVCKLSAETSTEGTDSGLMTITQSPKSGGFRAVSVRGELNDGEFKASSSDVLEKVKRLLEIGPGTEVNFMPYY